MILNVQSQTTADPADAIYAYDTILQFRDVLNSVFPDYGLSIQKTQAVIDALAAVVDPASTPDRKFNSFFC